MFFATLADVSTHDISVRLVLIGLAAACLQQQETSSRDVQADRETGQILQDHSQGEHSVHPRATGYRRCARRVCHMSPPSYEFKTDTCRDIAELNKEIEEIVAERKSRLRRYVSAKQHRAKLEGVAKKLEEARGNYTVRSNAHAHTSITILTSLMPGGGGHAERNDDRRDVRAHVQAYTLLVRTTPVYASGTLRADAATFPFNAPRIEEVGTA